MLNNLMSVSTLFFVLTIFGWRQEQKKLQDSLKEVSTTNLSLRAKNTESNETASWFRQLDWMADLSLANFDWSLEEENETCACEWWKLKCPSCPKKLKNPTFTKHLAHTLFTKVKMLQNHVDTLPIGKAPLLIISLLGQFIVIVCHNWRPSTHHSDRTKDISDEKREVTHDAEESTAAKQFQKRRNHHATVMEEMAKTIEYLQRSQQPKTLDTHWKEVKVSYPTPVSSLRCLDNNPLLQVQTAEGPLRPAVECVGNSTDGRLPEMLETKPEFIAPDYEWDMEFEMG